MFLQAWNNCKSIGILSLLYYINAGGRSALELLVYADQLYIDHLNPVNANLEKFLRSISPTPTLDDIQPHFAVNICIQSVLRRKTCYQIQGNNEDRTNVVRSRPTIEMCPQTD